MKRIKIFDTTLRDGEQSPGCSMNLSEKVEMAKQLELAAKEENHYFIESHHSDAMKEYRRILKGISEALSEKAPEAVQEVIYEKSGWVLVVDDDSMNLKIAEKKKKDIEIAFHPGYLEEGEQPFEGMGRDFNKFYYSKNRKMEFDTLINLKKEG